MKAKQKIGIMGGTFDPIHLGHLIIAETAMTRLELDKIIFIPVGNPPHKDKSKITSPFHRLNMIDLSIQSNRHFSSSDIEIIRPGETYTIDTLMQLHQQYMGYKIFFITGADAMDSISTWKDYNQLFKYAKFVVVTRGCDSKYSLKEEHEKFKNEIIILDTPFIEISSTQIRQNIRDDISIRYMVRDDVRNYIYENKLYINLPN